jgi:hypothetical protein
MEALDKTRQRMTTGHETFLEEPVEGEQAAEPTEGTAEEPENKEGPFHDKRLSKTFDTLEEADRVRKSMESGEYDQKRVQFSVEQTVVKEGEEEKAKYMIVAKDRLADDAFTPEEFSRVRESPKYNRSKVSEGIITVKTKAHPSGVKVNLVNLTREMIRQTPRQDVGTVDYLYDMVSRGLSKLLGDPNVTGFSDNTMEQMLKPGDQTVTPRGGRYANQERTIPAKELFNFPDNTPVASFGKGPDGKPRIWTWGEVKERLEVGARELFIKRLTSNAVEAAHEASSVSEIQETVMPMLDRRIAGGETALTEAKVASMKAGGRSKKLRDEVSRISRILDRFRLAKERVLEEIDRRAQEGDAPRSDIKGLVEDERKIEGLGRENPIGKRTVEGDIGGNPNADALDTGLKDSERQSSKPRLKKTTMTPEQVAEERALNRSHAAARAARNPLTPSQVEEKGVYLAPEGKRTDALDPETMKQPVEKKVAAKPAATPETSDKPGVLTIEQEKKFRKWREKNPGKTADDWLQAGQPSGRRKSNVSYVAGDTPFIASSDSAGNIKINREKAEAERKAGFPYFLGKEDSPGSKQKGEVAKRLGLTEAKLKMLFPTAKSFEAFLRAHEESHIRNKDAESYPRDANGKYDLTSEKALEIEVRATHDALPKPKLSAQNVAREEITPELAQQVRDYIAKVLGKDAKVLFKKMAAAGSFAKLSDIETLAIALDAGANALGVARHEAAHALVARLLKSDPRAAQTLLAAAGAPYVVSKLRTLLKDHPAALEQLSDPEERVAYMFQFWASDQLRVGPNTKTFFDKMSGFFRKVAALWGETYSDIRDVEKAEQIFELFDSGRLQNPNTVQEVLATMFPQTRFDKATDLMGPLYKGFEKAFFTAEGLVRDMNIPAFTEESQKFYTPTGKTGVPAGFLQTRYQVANKYLNKITDVLKAANPEQQRLAIEALQTRTDPTDPAAKRLVDESRKMLREVFDYMKQADVKAVVWNEKLKEYEEHEMHFVENYFPRYYSRDAINADPKGFIHDLVTPRPELGYKGMAPAAAKQVLDNLLRKSKVDPDENDFSTGLTYYAPNTMERKLDVPDQILAKWQRKDLYTSLASYVTYATRRGEYARRFGNQGQTIEQAIATAKQQGATTDQIRTFNQAVQAFEGSLGHDIAPELKQIFGGLVTYQNIRLLPLALFSSLTTDPMGIVVRGGTLAEAFDGFVRGLRALVSENKDEAYEMAATIGTIAKSHDAHMLAESYGNQYLTEWQRNINNKFFKWIGMEGWNRGMRVAATAAAERFILRHAAGYNEHSDRFLRELNLTKDDVETQGGKLVLNDKTMQAITMWVDGAVLRPNAAVRPIWMSDPHWMLVAHLKQFTYSFQKTIVTRVVHEIEHGNFSPAMSLISYVPLIIGADVARAVLTPGGADDDAMHQHGLGGLLWRGIQRAGLFGPGQYAVDAFGDLGHGKLPVTALAGPSVQQALDFGYAGFSPDGSVGKELLKAIPGYVLVRNN